MPLFADQNELRKLLTGTTDLDSKAILKRALLTKARDWEYEQEWRVCNFDRANAPQFLGFNSAELSAVYFGCRSSETDQDAIMDAAREVNPLVKFYLARKADRAFAIEFEDLT